MNLPDEALIEGQQIVARKLAAFRAAHPTAEMIHERSVNQGREIVAGKLQAAREAKALATTPAPPAPSPQITQKQFETVCDAARAAALAAAKEFVASSTEKPKFKFEPVGKAGAAYRHKMQVPRLIPA